MSCNYYLSKQVLCTLEHLTLRGRRQGNCLVFPHYQKSWWKNIWVEQVRARNKSGKNNQEFLLGGQRILVEQGMMNTSHRHESVKRKIIILKRDFRSSLISSFKEKNIFRFLKECMRTYRILSFVGNQRHYCLSCLPYLWLKIFAIILFLILSIFRRSVTIISLWQ